VDEIIALKAALAEALAEIARLRAEIVGLKEQLRQNSRNSSKPPSSDMGRGKMPKAPAGRKPGGQPGHAGTTREVVPPEKVDEVVDQDPDLCANCGTPLVDAPRLDADIRQIVETPEFKAFVREFRLWKKRCPKCGGFTRGKLSPGSPKGAFGPRIQATTAMLSGRFRLSRREVRSMLRLMAGVEMGLGSVQACCEAASGAMASTHGDLHAEVKVASAVHADETGFGRCGDLRMWLWNATSDLTEVFRLLPGRGGAQAKDLLGEGFSGILHRDRWKPYEHLPSARSQLCHAHLRRHFQAMLEDAGETATQGAMLKLASDRAFHLWHQFERREINRQILIQRMKPIQKEIQQRLVVLRDHPDTQKKARGIAKDLLRQWESLWTYVQHEGAVPTNNEAERALRKAVLWRKGSFGVNSLQGAAFVERILTLAGTTRRRGLGLLEWLTQAIQADLDGKPAPSLV
jgi:transposase